MTIETRPWGTFEVLCEAPGIKVKRLIVNPGHRLSLQKHHYRSEIWLVKKCGFATVELANRNFGGPMDWTKKTLYLGMQVDIPAGTYHRLENISGELEIIEIQTGSKVEEDDIQRLADDYGRV